MKGEIWRFGRSRIGLIRAMKSFRSEVQIRVLSLNGRIDEMEIIINGDEIKSLDISIMKLAAEVIASPGQFIAFTLAYMCKPSWEEITELYARHFPHLGENGEIETIRRYARDGKKCVFDRSALPKVS